MEIACGKGLRPPPSPLCGNPFRRYSWENLVILMDDNPYIVFRVKPLFMFALDVLPGTLKNTTQPHTEIKQECMLCHKCQSLETLDPIYSCISPYSPIYIHLCNVYIEIYMCVYISVYIHTYAYIHISIYIYICNISGWAPSD